MISATCDRLGPPPAPFAGSVVTGVLPRLTPRTPSPRMTEGTWPGPTSFGSRPRAINWACVFPYPYTAMKKSARMPRMSRANAS